MMVMRGLDDGIAGVGVRFHMAVLFFSFCLLHISRLDFQFSNPNPNPKSIPNTLRLPLSLSLSILSFALDSVHSSQWELFRVAAIQ